MKAQLRLFSHETVCIAMGVLLVKRPREPEGTLHKPRRTASQPPPVQAKLGRAGGGQTPHTHYTNETYSLFRDI